MFTLTFYGGAQSVTGSKHMVSLENGKKVLLDCGMFQGKGQNSEKYNREFGFDPASVNYLILSHAHIDHSGLIPRLVKLGFTGPVFCTPQTAELAALILNDSANIQNEADAQQSEKDPLYTKEDVEQALKQIHPVPYNTQHEFDEQFGLMFTDAGHILGSAVVNLTVKTKHRRKQLCFSGDVGRFDNRILNKPQPFPDADYIICESTYGDRLHEPLQNSEERLLELVTQTCVEKKGKLLIPAFSIGRTQELIYSLNLLAEDGKLPDIPVFVDSPLAVYATDILKNNESSFNPQLVKYLKRDSDPFGFKNLHYITDKEESIMVKEMDAPCVIISSSGMMEGGRIRHHLKTCIEDSKNTILITGYCEPTTLGGHITNGEKEVHIMGEKFTVNAQVELLKEYSAHGDYGDILKFLHNQDKEKLKHIFLVHGEKRVMEKFRESLINEGYANVEIPGYMVSYSL